MAAAPDDRSMDNVLTFMPLERTHVEKQAEASPNPARVHRDRPAETYGSRGVASWSVTAHVKLHGYFSVPTWKPEFRGRLQQSIMAAMNQVTGTDLVIWKVGAYDGMSDSFWIPQISLLSDIVFVCSFNHVDALSERFVAFTQLEQGLNWIQEVDITGH